MTVRILTGDCRDVLATLPDESVHCVVTSPPYFGLRDYGHAGQIGLEPTPDAFVAEMVAVFREVRRVLRKDGTCWLNLGDSYYTNGTGVASRRGDKALGVSNAGGYTGYLTKAQMGGIKTKDLIGIPWMVAFALRADGWYLRQDIIWSKPNPMPESVRDRCTKAHEYLFVLAKSSSYWYDAAAIAEVSVIPIGAARRMGATNQNGTMRGDEDRHMVNDGTRNRRSVWTVATQPFSGWTETVRQVPVAWDAPDDGKTRITSPDCPLHGDHPVPASSAPYGGRGAGQQPHNGCTGAHPVQEQPAGSAPTVTPLELAIAERSSDLPAPSSAASATDHSNESRKTGRGPVTIPACTPSGESLDHTGDTSGEPARLGSAARKSESSIAAGAMADSPASQTHSRTVGTSGEQALSGASHGSSCTCEYYISKTEKTSHFATFPPDLIEPCIKAGCPSGGTVLDPFGGAGTTGLVADRLQRNAILIELNPEYAAMARKRIDGDAPLFSETAA